MVISQLFFRQDLDAQDLIPVHLLVSHSRTFEHEGQLIYELKIELKGIVPEENELVRHRSSLQALILAFEVARVFFKEFVDAGGKLFPRRFDSDVAWTGDGPEKLKYFLRPE